VTSIASAPNSKDMIIAGTTRRAITAPPWRKP
jgi:hypothetical protein